MLHEDYPVNLFPTDSSAQYRYVLYADTLQQRYALQPLQRKTRKRAIVQCGRTIIYAGGKIPLRLQTKTFGIGELRHLQPLELRSALFTAKHILHFWENTSYCPYCQRQVLTTKEEGQRHCPKCHQEWFIPISPAIILGIVRQGKLLVTRYAHRPYTGPALVAGYCAVGESLETTCVREALEETNLEVKAPFYYFGSQPWGLSGALLMGFFVKATKRRKLILADGELAQASWLTPEECQQCLPQEGPLSLTATMIKAFAEGTSPLS